MTSRIIALIDMDCFYVQVEERENPEMKGKPAVVVQYKNFKGGGIIAVNYEARARGIKRGGTHGDDAKKICPEVHIFQIPEVRGKADLTRYREAGKEVIRVLASYCDCVERASIDEAYLDLTSNIEQRLKELASKGIPLREYLSADKFSTSFVAGHEDEGLGAWLNKVLPHDHGRQRGDDSDEEMTDVNEEEGASSSGTYSDAVRLAMGALMVEEMRKAVYDHTGFRCSAGISHNKTLSKLGCGLNKPNKQTVVPMESVAELFTKIPIGKVRNLGGKLGATIEEDLKCNMMSDLAKIPLKTLLAHFDEKTSNWLARLAQGYENEVVSARQLPKSIGCGKNFRGPEALLKCEAVREWCLSFAEEISLRLQADKDENKRMARTMTVGVVLGYNKNMTRGKHLTRSGPLVSYVPARIGADAYQLIAKCNTSKEPDWAPPVIGISIQASNFEPTDGGNSGIMERFLSKDNIREPSTPAEFSSKPTPPKQPKQPFFGRRSTEPERSRSFFNRQSDVEKENDQSLATAVVELKELFPNLDEMTEDIAYELPPRLRAEALELIAKRVKKVDVDTIMTDSDEAKDDEGALLPEEMCEVNFSADEDNSEETRVCPECKQTVLMRTYESHKDFHMAARLQKEFELEAAQARPSGSSSAQPPARSNSDSVSAKKKANGKNGRVQAKITSFFQKV